MMMQQRHAFNVLYVFLIVGVCSIHGVESKKEKKTKDPTLAPSFAPSTSYPSGLPSSPPTLWPSTEPTKRPTLGPTSSPTKLPSGLPTEQPTELPTSKPTTRKPTSKPTESPISVRTELPTLAPTWDSSQFPSSGIPTVQPTAETTNTPSPTSHLSEPSNGLNIPVPRIQMALILSADDMTDVASDSLQNHISSFITVLLETKTGIEAVDMVSLELDVVPSTFMRQKIESGFSIKIEGMMQNTRGMATKESVREKVVEYFSASGVDDLETFLHGKSIASASVGELYVDGIVAFLYKEDGETATAARTRDNNDDVPFTRTGLFAILVGAVNVLFVTCSIYFYRQNYGTGSSVKYRSILPKLRQNTSTTSPTEQHHTDSESQNSRDISVHLSMHELEPSTFHRVDSYQEYDPTRLDRIISDAKCQGKKKRGSNAFSKKR
ncbi:unnamed protein product [Cylindrotheca closterium]|uniref:SEA domain-containing protein n=1 Tax=Cylindrotheca closterium TaxID=2856 RepID=A0AAD2GA51_9STRA|nr:unnamed protein product [Cylindrotheca closterium]